MTAGLYAANMPADVGGAGLDTVTWLLYEKELGRANYALHWTLRGAALEHPAGRHARAAREIPVPLHPGREVGLPGDDRAGRRFGPARHEGHGGREGRRLGAQRHQAFHQPCGHRRLRHRFHGVGRGGRPRGKRKKITAFFVDKGTPGFTVRDGYRNVSHRGYTNSILEFDDCRLPKEQILGEVHKGFEVANQLAGRDAPAGRRHLSRPRRTCAWPRRSNMPRSASSSANRSASSRAFPSSLPIWRRS